MNGLSKLSCYLPVKLKVLMAGSERLDLHMTAEK